MTSLASLCVLSLLTGSSAESPDEAGWAVVRTEADGLVLEERKVADSGFYELRVRLQVAAAPGKLAQAVWTFNPKGPEAAMVARREVLAEGRAEQVVYSLFTPPLVGKRESTIRFTRSAEGGGGVRIAYGTRPDTATPREEGAVQMKVRGLWTLKPDGTGGTFLEHRCLSDPGAGVTPFMAVGTQRDTLVAVARDVIARAR